MFRIVSLFLSLIIAHAGNWAFSQAHPQIPDEMRGAAIRFERFGGFAGIVTRFWIFPDGRILDEEGKQTKIPAKTVESFVSRIGTLTAPQDRKPGMCMDCYRYHVVISGAAGTRSFVVDEDSLYKPDEESRLANDLRTLLLKVTPPKSRHF